MYPATVIEVLIASPSETSQQRRAISEAVVNWNTTNAPYLGVVLLPVMWETHTYPDLAAPAQTIINKQIVDGSVLSDACRVVTTWPASTFLTAVPPVSMDFRHPSRSQQDRTRQEDRRSKFYEISDNLSASST